MHAINVITEKCITQLRPNLKGITGIALTVPSLLEKKMMSCNPSMLSRSLGTAALRSWILQVSGFPHSRNSHIALSHVRNVTAATNKSPSSVQLVCRENGGGEESKGLFAKFGRGFFFMAADDVLGEGRRVRVKRTVGEKTEDTHARARSFLSLSGSTLPFLRDLDVELFIPVAFIVLFVGDWLQLILSLDAVVTRLGRGNLARGRISVCMLWWLECCRACVAWRGVGRGSAACVCVWPGLGTQALKNTADTIQ